MVLVADLPSHHLHPAGSRGGADFPGPKIFRSSQCAPAMDSRNSRCPDCRHSPDLHNDSYASFLVYWVMQNIDYALNCIRPLQFLLSARRFWWGVLWLFV